jgi:hypothetical protein
MRQFWIKTGSLLFIIVLLSGCDQFSGDRKRIVDSHQEKAIRLYEQRDYKGAIAVYEDLLRRVPNEYETHFKIAQIYFGNLNDYLNAAYHYQKYINSPNPAPGQLDLAKSFFENAKLQFAVSVPNAGTQNSPELVKVRSENIALHRQIEDLKQELSTVRSKPLPPPNQNPPPTPPPAPAVISKPPSTPDTSLSTEIDPPSTAVAAKKDPPLKKDPPTPKTRTYVVRKGEGIQAIAEKVYGDRSKWKKILTANPSIKDPDQLKPGQVLTIP